MCVKCVCVCVCVYIDFPSIFLIHPLSLSLSLFPNTHTHTHKPTLRTVSILASWLRLPLSLTSSSQCRASGQGVRRRRPSFWRGASCPGRPVCVCVCVLVCVSGWERLAREKKKSDIVYVRICIYAGTTMLLHIFIHTHTHTHTHTPS